MCEGVRVEMCVRERQGERVHECVCLCVFEREKEGGRERESASARARERERERERLNEREREGEGDAPSPRLLPPVPSHRRATLFPRRRLLPSLISARPPSTPACPPSLPPSHPPSLPLSLPPSLPPSLPSPSSFLPTTCNGLSSTSSLPLLRKKKGGKASDPQGQARRSQGRWGRGRVTCVSARCRARWREGGWRWGVCERRGRCVCVCVCVCVSL